MDYHSHYGGGLQHHQQQMMLGNGGGLNLPDASSSSEKALMWSQSQYLTESGYSTQAPSISSIDTGFLNEQQNGQMDSQSSLGGQMDTTSNGTIMQPAQPTEWPPQQQQQAAPPAAEAATEATAAVEPATAADDTDTNAVANWMNYQDNSEMALKAIPELLKLIADEDLIVVQQAAILFNQMSRNEGPRMALIQTTNAVQCLVDCLNTTADLETARSLVGTLYNVSTQKPGAGVQAIILAKALPTLVKMLSAPMETIVSYAITTLHNVLLDCGDKIKVQLRKMYVIHQMIPLLSQSTNVKFLSIVVDCLQLLAFGNQEAKQTILELGGTQMLVNLLVNHNNYAKLLLNTTRLLKVLSVCSQNKPALVSFNAMQALSMHLAPNSTSTDTLQNILITLRNLSDAATRLNGLEQLVQNLLGLLATHTDFTVGTLAAGILSNLTCNNENNKKAALRAGAVQTLLRIVHNNTSVQKTQLVEPCVCALRHVTNRYSDMLLAQEQVRSMNGLHIVTQLMCMQPRAWPVIKAVLGLVRNFCSNQLNAAALRQNGIIEKLMQVLFDAYTEIQVRTSGGTNSASVVKIDDVNLFDIVEASSSALLILAKEHANQMIMKELDCLGFFVQMFYSPLASVQRAGVSLLAELAANKECAEVVEQQGGLHQFVQANFCNQYGLLKTISELAASETSAQPNSSASIILQHVTTLMQRLQEHKNQRAFVMQQQSRAQFQYQQPGGPVVQVQQQSEQVLMQQQGQQQMYYNSQAAGMQQYGQQGPVQPQMMPQAMQQQQGFNSAPVQQFF